jgi:hypothetical protein
LKKPVAKAARTAKPVARRAAPKAIKPAPKASPAAKATEPPKAAKVPPPSNAAKSPDGARTEKDDKARKPKLVRDSYTIPKVEYAVLEALKVRAAKAGTPAKKSELLRAGIKALAAMPESAFLAAVGAVPAIKTGRPAKA